MNKQAYEQGFIDACNYYNVDPQALVKWAGLGIEDARAALQAAKEQYGTLGELAQAGVIGLGASGKPLIGAALGAGVGSLLGKKHRIRNAVLGALVGGGVGAYNNTLYRELGAAGLNKLKGLFKGQKPDVTATDYAMSIADDPTNYVEQASGGPAPSSEKFKGWVGNVDKHLANKRTDYVTK